MVVRQNRMLNRKITTNLFSTLLQALIYCENSNKINLVFLMSETLIPVNAWQSIRTCIYEVWQISPL